MDALTWTVLIYRGFAFNWTTISISLIGSYPIKAPTIRRFNHIATPRWPWPFHQRIPWCVLPLWYSVIDLPADLWQTTNFQSDLHQFFIWHLAFWFPLLLISFEHSILEHFMFQCEVFYVVELITKKRQTKHSDPTEVEGSVTTLCETRSSERTW